MANKEKNFISAVIYVHNMGGGGEGKQIISFLSMVTEFFEANFEHSEIICVNDASTDNSVAIIKEFSKSVKLSSITILNMSYFHGLEMAMNAGVDLAIGDFVLEFDTTLPDFNKDEIMRAYSRSLEGYDIVSVSPDKKEKTSSKLFYKTFNHFAKLNYQMKTESFRILSRRVINRIASMNKTIPYRKAIYAGCGLKTDNIKYHVNGMSGKHIDQKESGYRVRLAVDSMILFTEIGYRFSIMMTVLMMIISVLALLYSIVVYITTSPVAGWTTTILFLSVAFFGLFGILTVIIKYLQLLIDLVFKRKHYNFESIEKLTG